MINRIVCKGLMVTDWANHGNLSTARIGILDTKKDNKRAVWIKVKAFNKTAEILQKYTRKNTILFIDGRLDMDVYETKDGTKKYEYSILIDKVEWEWQDKKPQQTENQKPNGEEDVPF